MAKITAILPDEETAGFVTDQLAALHNDKLDWRLVEPEDDNERILPAIGWPLGGGAANTTSGAPVAVPMQYDYPEDEALKDRGVDPEEAESYSQSVDRGSSVIIINTPSDSVERVRHILQEANAQQIDVDR